MGFGTCVGATDLSLLPEVGEMTPLVEGDQFHKFLRNGGFYLTVRNPLSVQGEPLLDIWTFCFFWSFRNWNFL